MNCYEIIESFLLDIGLIKDDYESLLQTVHSYYPAQFFEHNEDKYANIIKSIIVDNYKLNALNVKNCSKYLKELGLQLGRHEKNLLKEYFDYHESTILFQLEKLIKIHDIKVHVEQFYENHTLEAYSKFLKNWNDYNDIEKRIDFINAIYSRLYEKINKDNNTKATLKEIFSSNEKFYTTELSLKSYVILKEKCTSDELNLNDARVQYNSIYSSLLNNFDSPNDQYKVILDNISINNSFKNFLHESIGLVVFDICQALYDSFLKDEDFMDYILSVICNSYRVLDNHRTFVVNISNIINRKKINIKWELYSYISIYSEHFIKFDEQKKFYTSYELVFERCKQLNIDLSVIHKDLIKKYLKREVSLIYLSNKLYENNFPRDINLSDVLLDFNYLWYGFSFSDCLINVYDEKFPQSNELDFIQNNNEITLIFNKYRPDDRKIPCPDCSSLNISGNSFTEVGLRSWECKNPLCVSRSKSNRGKRYSKKTNFMQTAFKSSIDIISRDLIKKFRRDVTHLKNRDELFEMIIKYFSFSKDTVLLINNSLDNNSYGRKCVNIGLPDMMLDVEKFYNYNNVFNDYFNNGYVSRFLNLNKEMSYKKIDTVAFDCCVRGLSQIIHGDSYNVLKNFSDEFFNGAVTSPPYYNAREYSQWPNIYLYLHDMFNIAKEVFRTLKSGAVFVYNIGDICGNENIVTKSTMGIKRIALGAYIVLIFKKAGFELLDNIIWDKGEPQSQRQKNDGKFTPFYQKPLNAYEHMFIFKKPGALLKNFDIRHSISNVMQFIPVIKINNKGNNMVGHTAPFPNDIPELLIKFFTNENEQVLDPFAGSGTTLFVANKLNRKSIGIELNEEYFNLIKDRI